MRKNILVLSVVVLMPCLAWALGTWTFYSGHWYNQTTGQTLNLGAATYPPGYSTWTPTSTPTSTPTIQATVSLAAYDGKNLYSTFEAPGTYGITTGLLSGKWMQDSNNAVEYTNAAGFWFRMDPTTYTGTEFGIDGGDFRVIHLTSWALFRCPGYDFEDNGTDYGSNGLYITNNATNGYFLSYGHPIIVTKGINAGASTIAAGTYAYQPGPVGTFTPAVSTPVITSAKSFSVTQSGVTWVYWGGVLQTVNSTPVQ